MGIGGQFILKPLWHMVLCRACVTLDYLPIAKRSDRLASVTSHPKAGGGAVNQPQILAHRLMTLNHVAWQMRGSIAIQRGHQCQTMLYSTAKQAQPRVSPTGGAHIPL